MRQWIRNFFSRFEKVNDSPAIVSAPELDASGVSQTVPSQLDECLQQKRQGDAYLASGDFPAAGHCYRRAITIKPDFAEAISNLGFAQKEQGSFLDSEQYLEQALAIDPTICDVYYMLGSLSQAQGKTDLACAHFRKALELAPDFDIVYRDYCYLMFELGRLDDAKRVIMEGIAFVPNNADLHFYLGNLHHAELQFDLATNCLQNALSIQPDYLEVLTNLGLVYFKKNDLERATATFKNVLALNPAFVDAYNNFGNVLHRRSALDKAIAVYKTGLEIDPRSSRLHYNLGISLHAQFKIDEAITHYGIALNVNPEYTDAHMGVGKALQEMGDHDEAVRHFDKLLSIDNHVEAQFYRGISLHAIQQHDGAKASYREALRINPYFFEAYLNLGSVFNDLGDVDDAAKCYRRALEINPHFAEAFLNLGNASQMLGELDGAMKYYQRALEIQPELAAAQLNHGIVLRALGKLEEALPSVQRALEIKPNFAEAQLNLGIILKDMDRSSDAMARFRRATEINPDFSEAHFNLGLALKDIWHLDDAIASYQRALEIRPDFADIYVDLGIALRELDQLDEAGTSCRRALEIKPDHVEAHISLGNVLHAYGQLDSAMASYRRAVKIKPDHAFAHDNLLMTLQFLPDTAASDIVRAHMDYAEQFETVLEAKWPVHTNRRDPNKRLRVGYVSGDFRIHAVAYFIEPVFANRDKSQVEVFCYSNSSSIDAFTEHLVARIDHWQPCFNMSDDQLAERILADGIDILVDLAGHTAKNRLLTFARKPAPIQITYLGYPGTSGLTAMDYRLSDGHTEPENDRYYTEKLLRLPDSMWCYSPAGGMSEVTPLPALQNGHLTFGSFNNINKVGIECIALWATLLRALPTSRLLMVTVPKGRIRQRLTQQFQELGIAANRIDFCGKLPPHEFRRMLPQVDITLDPFPINGATTTCESLWMGVPVLTLIGDRFLSRAGLSVLNAALLPEFAAATPTEYINIATSLAGNLQRLASIRSGLRAHLKATPLLDQQRFTQHLERLYREVWTTWCGEEK